MLLKSTWDRAYQCQAAVLLWQHAFGDNLVCRAVFNPAVKCGVEVWSGTSLSRAYYLTEWTSSRCAGKMSRGAKVAGERQDVAAINLFKTSLWWWAIPTLEGIVCLRKLLEENWNSWHVLLIRGCPVCYLCSSKKLEFHRIRRFCNFYMYRRAKATDLSKLQREGFRAALN